MKLEPVFAQRSVENAVVCGACGHRIAERHSDLLTFPQDVSEAGHWRGWECSEAPRPDLPGGTWTLAPIHGCAQPPLSNRLQVLPAVVECSFCTVPNQLDPKRLNVRREQSLARTEMTARSFRRPLA